MSLFKTTYIHYRHGFMYKVFVKVKFEIKVYKALSLCSNYFTVGVYSALNSV